MTVSAISQLLGRLKARSLELDRYLLRANSETEKISTQLELALWQILSQVLDTLQINADGLIKDTAANYNKVLPLSRLIDLWLADNAFPSIVRHMVNKVLGVSESNSNYFRLIEKDQKDLQKVMEKAGKRVYNALGLYTTEQVSALGSAAGSDFFSTGKGGLFVQKNSRLDGLAMLTGTTTTGTLRTEIANILNTAISGRANFFDTKKQFEELAGMNPNVSGRVSGYLNTAAFDTLNAQARHEHELVSKELKMNWFIYSGGLRKASRPFCREKAGKLFHRLDAKEWENQNFAGKLQKNYIGIIHLGGYHCYHRVAFVTDEVAAQIDPKKFEEEKYANYVD